MDKVLNWQEEVYNSHNVQDDSYSGNVVTISEVPQVTG